MGKFCGGDVERMRVWTVTNATVTRNARFIMDDDDPITQFFPDEESVDLYAVLSLTGAANADDIKKAYRRFALLYHPDKHAASSPSAKAESSVKFQQVGFAYAVLSDEKRRQRYNRTGKTDEGFELAAGEDGWEAYFEDLFERVTRGKLDEMKKEYQGMSLSACLRVYVPFIYGSLCLLGSNEEVDDLKVAYIETGGSIGEILNHIPHSTIDDEPRFIVLITNLIANGELPLLQKWESSIRDEKSKLVRKKQGQKEAKEAEKLAKELGVWDEFYGSGRTGNRKGKGKTKQDGEDADDHSALQAIMLKRKKQKMDSFFDDLASKYAEPEPKGGKGRRRDKAGNSTEESPKKKPRGGAPSPPPEIDDQEFEKVQQRLFGDKGSGATTSKSKKGSKAKKAG